MGLRLKLGLYVVLSVGGVLALVGYLVLEADRQISHRQAIETLEGACEARALADETVLWRSPQVAVFLPCRTRVMRR